MKKKTKRTWWTMTLAAGAVGLMFLGTGCSSGPAPTHTARFWTQSNNDIVVQVTGQKPTIQVENHGPGAIQRVDLISAEHTTSFDGIPPGGSTMFTLVDGARLRIAESNGTFAILTLWNADGYQLFNDRGEAVTLAANAQD